MFKITNETKNKEGYILIDKIFIAHPSENGFETRLAQIELYGKAIKTSIYDKSFSTIVEVIDYFADDHITVSILQYPSTDNDLYIYEFNKTIIVSNQEQMSSLREYASLVMANPDIFDYSSTDSSDINSLSGIEFENLCKNLLEKMNFEVSTTKQSGDGGIDLIAYNHQPLLEGKYVVQCKRYSGSVGEPIIRDLYGVVNSERANKGILITSGSFTNSAITFAAGKQLELIDGYKLSILLKEYEVTHNSSSNKPNNDLLNVLEESAILFDIDQYNTNMRKLADTPNDDITRVVVIKNLLDTIINTVPDIEDYFDKCTVIAEIKKQILLYSKYHNSSNKKTKYMDAVLTVLYIQLSIIDGCFSDAIKSFIELMNRSEIQIKDIDRLDSMFIDNAWFPFSIYSSVYNVVQIALISQDSKFIERLYQLGRSYIDIVENHYLYTVSSSSASLSTQKEYAKKELDRIKNIRNLNSLYFVDGYLIEKCMEYTYYNYDAFPYAPEPYKAEIVGNSLYIKEYSSTEKIFAKIDNISSKKII